MSRETREDVLRLFDVAPERVHVIHNGIDTEEYRHRTAADVARSVRRRSRPRRTCCSWAGSRARRASSISSERSATSIPPSRSCCAAGAPDTKEIAAEMEAAVAEARAAHPRSSGSPRCSTSRPVRQLYSHAAVFCCPSVYEPFGIINLEAMACETAVVASAVGGIPEVVVDGETGLLVPFEPAGGTSFEPKDPERFERDLAAGIMAVIADPAGRESMAKAGRRQGHRALLVGLDRPADRRALSVATVTCLSADSVAGGQRGPSPLGGRICAASLNTGPRRPQAEPYRPDWPLVPMASISAPDKHARTRLVVPVVPGIPVERLSAAARPGLHAAQTGTSEGRQVDPTAP